MRSILFAIMLASCTPDISSDAAEVDTGPEPILCENRVGYEACDLQLLDQDGNLWKLSDQRGKVVALDFSAMWCAPCQDAAVDQQAIQDFYGTESVVMTTILIENLLGEEPNQDDLNEWADVFGITSARVLGGNTGIINPVNPEGWELTNWPTFWTVDENGLITSYAAGFYGHTLTVLNIEAALYH
jgi:thiol-disulfide isomerase/thioredoxin